MNITISTQTPPFRLNLNYRDLLEKYPSIGDVVNLEELSNEDYHFSVGGVPKMMFGLMRKIQSGKLRWISLGPGYPPHVKYGNMDFHFVSVSEEALARYTRFKECIYNESHGLARCEVIASKDYLGYLEFNLNVARKMLEFYEDSDAYLVNDFQELLLGGIIGPSAPVVIWYHIPFVPDLISHNLREFIIRSLEAFDYVIVSTKRDLEGLIKVGAKLKVRQIYPYIDPSEYVFPSENEIKEMENTLGIEEDEQVILLVARMDPIKSHDLAIKAVKDIDAKLVLVGDGSFTSKTLGHDKASLWLSELKNLVKELNIEDKVIFTGYLDQRKLCALYERANLLVLPSKIEGFGLSVCEAWFFGKPVVVSDGAGVSELVIEGGNGYVFKKGDQLTFREKIKLALKQGEKMKSLAKETVKKCLIENTAKELFQVLEEARKEYEGSKLEFN